MPKYLSDLEQKRAGCQVEQIWKLPLSYQQRCDLEERISKSIVSTILWQ